MSAPVQPGVARRHHLLGVTVDAITVTALTKYVAEAVASGGRTLVANHNLHSVALCRQDERLRDFYRLADLTFIDSTWLVRFGRVIGEPLRQRHRTTYLDWLDQLMQRCQRDGLKIAHVGAPEAVAQAALRELQVRYPGIRLAVHHGYFDATRDSAESVQVLQWIERESPDLLLIGMGMPRQEHWIADHFDRLPACVVLTSGACFGYLGGEQKSPPRWSGVVGLEWAFRLMAEPRRLWHRYLVEPLPVVGMVVRETCARRLRRRR